MSSRKGDLNHFSKLPANHQRALHELWLRRVNSTFVVSQETLTFLEQNQTILREEFDKVFEREPMQIGEYTQNTDSLSDLVWSPPTPLHEPDSGSESEGELRVDTSKSNSKNYSRSFFKPTSQEEEGYINRHEIRSGVITLHKSPRHYSPSTVLPM
jgi:hypothetical protein